MARLDTVHIYSMRSPPIRCKLYKSVPPWFCAADEELQLKAVGLGPQGTLAAWVLR